MYFKPFRISWWVPWGCFPEPGAAAALTSFAARGPRSAHPVGIVFIDSVCALLSLLEMTGTSRPGTMASACSAPAETRAAAERSAARCPPDNISISAPPRRGGVTSHLRCGPCQRQGATAGQTLRRNAGAAAGSGRPGDAAPRGRRRGVSPGGRKGCRGAAPRPAVARESGDIAADTSGDPALPPAALSPFFSGYCSKNNCPVLQRRDVPFTDFPFSYFQSFVPERVGPAPRGGPQRPRPCL